MLLKLLEKKEEQNAFEAKREKILELLKSMDFELSNNEKFYKVPLPETLSFRACFDYTLYRFALSADYKDSNNCWYRGDDDTVYSDYVICIDLEELKEIIIKQFKAMLENYMG